MTDECRYLHKAVYSCPRYDANYDPGKIPENGIYFLFEKGEEAHGGERIVRIGTHRGQNNLPKRLKEHLFTKNKDRSIFRKHIGRCLLKKDGDPFASDWEKDLTTREDREKYSSTIDREKLARAEDRVTAYMNGNFTFSVLEVFQKTDRMFYEKRLLSTCARCQECRPSTTWLGIHHPNPIIPETGLWNIQGLSGAVLSEREIDELFGRASV